ncbi:MAG: helicase-related protein [bacterium]|nr:helicase-related protein [bacterium]
MEGFIIKEGDIIEGSFWEEPVKVDKVEDWGSYIHLIGSTIYSKRHIDQVLSKDDFSKIKIRKDNLDFTGDPEEVFLHLEATRFKYASLFDPLLAMNVSKIDPLPFQLDAVYGYVLKLPKIRFLIADDPGAGKTIMAGLVIKELKLRGVVKRILIVVPGHLKDQWRRELKDKFDEIFEVIDRSTFNNLYGENPFLSRNQIITSLDFAKQEEILPSLSSVDWDLVIVDEAHKMSAYAYGNNTQKTQRYKLGEVLSRTTNHLLFLTATPHKGDSENFRLFLDLLVPGFFATTEMIEESIKNRDNPLFIRRLKEELRNFKGEPIFTRRFSKTIKFTLSDKEKELYNEVSRYIMEECDKSTEEERQRNVIFALVILQKRIASSVYALLKSLERRKNRLEELLKNKETLSRNLSTLNLETIEEQEEQEESERWKKEEEWERITLARSREEVEREIQRIQALINKANLVIKEDAEIKLGELRKAIEEGFKKIGEIGGNKKILIFTESKDTLEYLVDRVKKWGYKVNFIHGGMNIEDRIEAEKVFKNETEIMVATEAAGEGINLQFCHIMINYDIPWVPTRLEQRMGRIHRYGQQKDVYIFNLVAEDTKEGEVLSKLLEKLDEIREKLGSDKVYDVIGDIFSGKNLFQLIVDAVMNAKSMDEILKEIDIKLDEETVERIRRECLGESLATKYIDLSKITDLTEKAKEYRLVPEYVEEFFKKAFVKLGGEFTLRKDGFLSIENIPREIRKIAEDENFKSKFGQLIRKYPKVTFDKDIAFKNPDAEFVSFGHPLLEAVLEWIRRNLDKEITKGSVFKDPSGRYNGAIFFAIVEVMDGKGTLVGKRLFAIYTDGSKIEVINPAILWDLLPAKNCKPDKIILLDNSIKNYILKLADGYKSELLAERERQAEIKRRYGLKSLEHLILELDTELAELYSRLDLGEKVDLPIRNKEEQKRRYEDAKKELESEIEREVSLSIGKPEIIGSIYVIPERIDMVSDEEIERIGMEVAMSYERSQGRNPEDVSKENLGFDIRSKNDKEIRYIEVKARADEGEIALTPNEYIKAKRFGKDYWLYIVTNCRTEPTLYTINNPVENLKFIERLEVVRYMVPIEEWKKEGFKEKLEEAK